MKFFRKEHISLYIDGFVYVLGGYESLQSRFLLDCERYNLIKDEWEVISNMNKARCAFGAVSY